jgi:hypothetical protein
MSSGFEAARQSNNRVDDARAERRGLWAGAAVSGEAEVCELRADHAAIWIADQWEEISHSLPLSQSGEHGYPTVGYHGDRVEHDALSESPALLRVLLFIVLATFSPWLRSGAA